MNEVKYKQTYVVCKSSDTVHLYRVLFYPSTILGAFIITSQVSLLSSYPTFYKETNKHHQCLSLLLLSWKPEYVSGSCSHVRVGRSVRSTVMLVMWESCRALWAQPEGKTLDLPVDPRSSLHLWRYSALTPRGRPTTPGRITVCVPSGVWSTLLSLLPQQQRWKKYAVPSQQCENSTTSKRPAFKILLR